MMGKKASVPFERFLIAPGVERRLIGNVQNSVHIPGRKQIIDAKFMSSIGSPPIPAYFDITKDMIAGPRTIDMDMNRK
jgi:hypothetical protein